MRTPIIHCGVCMLRDQAFIGRQAVTTEEGFLFESIVGRPGAFGISDNGRSIILKATLPGSISGAFLIDFDADCPWNLDGHGGVRVGPSETARQLGRGP